MVDFLPPKAASGVATAAAAPNVEDVNGRVKGEGNSLNRLLQSNWLSVLEKKLLTGLAARIETALHRDSSDEDDGDSGRGGAGSRAGTRGRRRTQANSHTSSALSLGASATGDGVGGGGGGGARVDDSGAASGSAEDDESGSHQSRLALTPEACGPDPFDKLKYRDEAPSSSGSEGDGYGPSTSIDSPDGENKFYIRSGSEGSVKSWASSLSLDSQSDEATATTVDFMRTFVTALFTNPSDISLEEKARFGHFAQTELGRLWFARLVNAQRVHHKRVSESTFYSLVQHLAVVLFECAEADDFSPAKSLMNMCFTFYHEVEPASASASASADEAGGESSGPVREYLSVYLREQPIWHSLRFWNAALFDALQCDRATRPPVTRDDVRAGRADIVAHDQQLHENATFAHLGTFTCSMHAFGLSRDFCMEFLRKQCAIGCLREDQEKMLRENVDRMYSEVEPGC